MSASMYNSPYTYQQPLPKIKYPPLFAGLFKMSFRHVLDSKFLALAALLFAVALFVSLICIISPFWFKLVFNKADGTFGAEAVQEDLNINIGIFFANDEEFDNLIDINKYNNQNVAPRLFVLSQVLQMIGVCMLVASLGATGILVFRKFGSPTANFILAFFTAFTGVVLALVFLFCLIMSFMSSCEPGDSCTYKDNLKWRVFPIYSQFFRVEPLVSPYIKLNWSFYISLFPAIVTIAGSALVWIEACKTFSALRQIRYTQLRTERSQFEGDINPVDHKKYVYSAPVMSGPMSYGMQPVMFQGGPYSQPPYSGQNVGFDNLEPKRIPSPSSSPPARRRSPPPPRRRSPSPPSPSPSPPSRRRSPPPRRRSPSPPSRRDQSPPSRRRDRSPPPRRGPPSLNSSMSEGPYISREIDL